MTQVKNNNNVIAIQPEPQLQPRQSQAVAITTNFAPQNFDQLQTFAEIAAQSAFVPSNYQKNTADIILAVQMGAELGLAPLQSLQNIAVINGRPSLFGDAMLALCKSSFLCEYIEEEFEGQTQKDWVAICKTKRKGDKKETIHAFSWKDAETAGLTNKSGPWKTYPKRMLQMRARGFALRDAFPDLLKGLIIKEEAEDYPINTTNNSYENKQQETNHEVKHNPVQDQQSIDSIDQQCEWFVSFISKIETREKLEKLTSNNKLIDLRKKLDPSQTEQINDAINRKLIELENISIPMSEPPAERFPEEMPDAGY